MSRKITKSGSCRIAKAQKSISASIRVLNLRQSAFSLIELIVVMGLMFFLTGTFILTLRRSGNVNQLKDAAQELQSELRNAKNVVLSGEIKTVPVGAVFESRLIKATGIKFKTDAGNNDRYVIRYYSDPDSDPDGTKEETVLLPSGIIIEGLTGTINQHIIYNNPSGNVYIVNVDDLSMVGWSTETTTGAKYPNSSQNCTTYPSATITLRNNNNFKIDIVVDCRSGSINVQNLRSG